ncbi:MAG: hypothetical protein RLZZ04_1390 [Cyanobacteriota bacterium]
MGIKESHSLVTDDDVQSLVLLWSQILAQIYSNGSVTNNQTKLSSNLAKLTLVFLINLIVAHIMEFATYLLAIPATVKLF